MIHLFASKFKYFTVLLSTFALLHLQIGVVYAQAENDQIGQQRVQQSQAQQSTASQNRTQEMATATKEVNLDKTSAGMSDMIYFLVLIAMSLFVMSLWRYTPMSTDMRIAMGAATVMLGAELVTIFQTRKKIDAGNYKVVVQEDGTVNNMQVDALKEQRESYESLKKYASLKWKIQMAGAAAYTVSATLAYIQASRITVSGKKCLAGLKLNNCPIGMGIHAKGQVNFWTPMDSKTKGALKTENLSELNASFASCTGYAGVDAAKASGAAALSCQDFVMESLGIEPVTESVDLQVAKTDYNSFNHYAQNTHQELLNSKDIILSDFSQLIEHTEVIIPYDKKTEIVTLLVSTTYYNEKRNENTEANSTDNKFIDALSSLLIPQAQAFTISQLGLGAAAAIILYALVKGSYKWMDLLIMNPAHRANLYLATAAAAGVTAVLTKKAESQAEDNIKKIDEMLARFDRLQKAKVANLDQSLINTALSGQLLPQDMPSVSLSAAGRKTPCPPTTNAAPNRTTCRSFEQDIKNSADIGSLGSVMGNMAVLSGRVADGFTGTDSLSAGTMEDIANLSSQNAIAGKALRQAQDQFNEFRKSNGDKAIDFDRQRDDLLKAVGASVQSELRNIGQSPSQAVAGIGSSFTPSDEKSSVAQEEMKMETSTVASKGGANMNNVKAPEFDFSFGDDGFTEAVVEDDFSYSDDMYAKAFDNISTSGSGGTSQIVGNRDVSLFQVISVRYMKSGLPRLLQEIE